MASVSKRGKTWEIRYRVKDAMGQITQKRVGGFKTKEEAWAKAGQIEQAANMNDSTPRADLSIGMIMERWFSEHAAQNVAQTTLSRYSLDIERLSHYNIYNEPVKNLTKARYAKIFNYMQEHSEIDGFRRSTATVNTYLEVLRYSMSWAVSQSIIPFNPISGFRLGKAARTQTKEPDYLEENDIQDLLRICKGKRIYTPVLLALYGGLRAEECSGLKWSAVNFDRNTISIIEVRTHDSYGKLVIKEPKSKSSKRTITMPQFVMDYLKQLPRESEHVCVSKRRSHYMPARLTSQLRRMEDLVNEERKANNQPLMPLASFHDLRHTHAAMLIKLNVQPKVISERLGHSSIRVTMDTYGYLMAGLQEDAANRLINYN